MKNTEYCYRKIFLFLLLSICLSFSGFNQGRYRIFLKDKPGVIFDPYSYFDIKAIERRIINHISLYDSTDFPVNENYRKIVASISDSIYFVSRWFNFVSISVSTDSQLKKISRLPFVVKIEPVDYVNFQLASTDVQNNILQLKNSGLQEMQLRRMGGNLFEENHIDGKGIRIALFDAGFPWVNSHPAFEKIRDEKRIIKTWDFTKNKENVYYSNKHGAMTMACIGGEINGKKIGLATGAEFLLAKTEILSELFSEEENWLAAAEWADKNGANIISSSLGYTFNRYFIYQMDGKTSLVVKAANMAARKGILVVSAAGNDGNTNWKYISTPADGDSVLAVGGINPLTDYHINYSSFGPTADKRLKPNVCAYSHVITVSKNDTGSEDGTSFATPLVAGFAACVLQLNNNLKIMELFTEIERSGHLYPYYDYAHGFGIPQASYFIFKEHPFIKKTFDINKDSEYLTVVARNDVTNSTDWIGNDNLLYYHIADEKGVIKEYSVIKAELKEILRLDLTLFDKGDKLMIFFRGYTETMNF